MFKEDILEIVISMNAPNNGFYNWMLPSDLNSSDKYSIKIKDALDYSVYDFSDYFEINSGFLIIGYNNFIFLSIIFGISVILWYKTKKNMKF